MIAYTSARQKRCVAGQLYVYYQVSLGAEFRSFDRFVCYN